MMKNSFFWRFLHENGMKPNPIHAAETHSSNGKVGGLSLWGSDWGPWVHGRGTWLYVTWMRPNDALDGLFGVLWTTTPWLLLWAYRSFDKPSLESFLAGIKAHSARSSCGTATGSGRCRRNDPMRDAEKHSSKCAQTRKGVHWGFRRSHWATCQVILKTRTLSYLNLSLNSKFTHYLPNYTVL